MPTLNAAPHMARSLAPLVGGVTEGLVRELIVSDGGSTDETCAIAEGVGATVVRGGKGRGAQLMAGAAVARAPWLLFLHADTALEEGWADEAGRFIAAPSNLERAAAFRFAFDDDAPGARRAEWWVGVRTSVLKLPYGDQGLLISRRRYEALGGFKPLKIMEDVELVRRIPRRERLMLRTKAMTSAARYRRDGYLKRPLRNLTCLTLYTLRAPSSWIERLYGL